MKKVNLLSKEELKKVQGGAPPFTTFWMYCVDGEYQLMGPPVEVPECNPYWYESYCTGNGYPTAVISYSYCQGAW